MLEFVVIVLPGVIFAYFAEFLMKRRLHLHAFLSLAAFHVLVLNVAALALGSITVDFLSADGYTLALGNADFATGIIKQVILSALIGIPLCLAEAFLGKFLSVSLEDRGQEKKEPENGETPSL